MQLHQWNVQKSFHKTYCKTYNFCNCYTKPIAQSTWSLSKFGSKILKPWCGCHEWKDPYGRFRCLSAVGLDPLVGVGGCARGGALIVSDFTACPTSYGERR